MANKTVAVKLTTDENPKRKKEFEEFGLKSMLSLFYLLPLSAHD